MLAGPVPVQRWTSFHCHRSIFTANKFAVFQETDSHAMEMDAGLIESAEFNLASPRSMNLQLTVFKIAVVKLDMA